MQKRYVVTKESDDKTFLKGDHISFNLDGTISCIEAKGWIAKGDVEKACVGMECKIDIEWFEKQRDLLQAKFDRLMEGMQ